jgi:hypothetical protein
MSWAMYLAETLARLEADERDVATMGINSPTQAQDGFGDPVLPLESPPQSPSRS